jgi:hypothetical protein
MFHDLYGSLVCDKVLVSGITTAQNIDDQSNGIEAKVKNVMAITKNHIQK